MVKKGISYDEKRKRLLEWMYEKVSNERMCCDEVLRLLIKRVNHRKGSTV